MTTYINWMQISQPLGNTLQVEGNAVADYESPSSGVASSVAPEKANYASIWADVAVKIEATNLYGAESEYEYALPANTVVQLPNVTPGKTTITVTDL